MKKALFSAVVTDGYDARRFCSTQKAAIFLGVSQSTVQLWVENGILRAWRTAGGHRRISMDSIEKLVRARQDSVGAPILSKDNTKPGKVLLVDQDRKLLSLYEIEMKRWNLPMVIMKAVDGFKALIKIGEERPDVLVIDLNMSGMDVGHMIRVLHQKAVCHDIAIIVISSLEMNTVKAMCLPIDITVFTKPVAFDQLRSAVESALATATAGKPDEDCL
ncbi:MAG TPA: response regulator [Telluria sp.]